MSTEKRIPAIYTAVTDAITLLQNTQRNHPFKVLDNADMQELADGPPEFSVAPVHLAYSAAAVHKLCNDYSLNVPLWVFDKRCYLEKPFFGCNAQGDLRLLFMYKSPTEFKHRNLFVDENVLSRV